VGPKSYDLSINDLIFSRLLEGDHPSPECVKGEVQVIEEVKYEEGQGDYPELPMNVFESVVPRNNMIEELFGDFTINAKDNLVGSVSTATTSNTGNLHSRVDIKESIVSAPDEEVKENRGLDVVNVIPHRSLSTKVLNLLEFEETVKQPKRQLSDLLGEIDFHIKDNKPKVEGNFVQQNVNTNNQKGRKELDIDIFSNFGISSYLK
jgi:hypothetical protein